MSVNNIYNSSAKLVLKWKMVVTFRFLEFPTVKKKLFLINKKSTRIQVQQVLLF